MAQYDLIIHPLMKNKSDGTENHYIKVSNLKDGDTFQEMTKKFKIEFENKNEKKIKSL